ncbi:MAG TPA: type II toxin-antitoxin system Phd/YefM family antitoxin [Gammaproteobacteria bacterium]|jgi:prevent-host-death family protein|nr:type II toxin-antitoxin system Phd/YefM family antitoxin [Gammaproteobacteria bacterium]
MTTVNIHEAKTHFSKLIQEVMQGEEVIIARDGNPVVRLIIYTEETKQRHGGQLKGLIEMSDDFDAPLPNALLSQFYGEQD